MTSAPQICADSELYISDNCECDDCLSQKLDELNAVLQENIEKFDNEIISKINALQDNFANYYTMAQTADMISDLSFMNVEVVESLPDEGEENKLYLLENPNGSGNCNYTKWLYVNGQYESLTCDSDLNLLTLTYVTDCDEVKKTYVNEGSFEEYTEICAFENDYGKFDGWYCEESEDLYTGEIPEEWFTNPPCTSLLAKAYYKREFTFVDEENDKTAVATITSPGVFPTYEDLFGDGGENVYWDYEGELYDQGADFPIDLYGIEDAVFYVARRTQVTYTFKAIGDLPSAVALIVTQGETVDSVTLDEENEYAYTLTAYDDENVDGNIEDIEGYTIEKEISEDGTEFTFTFTEAE